MGKTKKIDSTLSNVLLSTFDLINRRSILYLLVFLNPLFMDSILTRTFLVFPVLYTGMLFALSPLVFYLFDKIGTTSVPTHKFYKIEKWVYLYGIVAFVGYLYNTTISNTLGISYFNILMLLVQITFFYVFLRSVSIKEFARMHRLFIIYGLVSACFSLFEVFVFNDFSGKLEEQVAGLFSDRNMAARFMTIASLFLLTFIATPEGRKYRSVGTVGLSVLFLAILMMFSRSGYLIYFISMGSLIYYLLDSKRRKLVPFVAIIFVILFGFMIQIRMKKDDMNTINWSDLGRLMTNVAAKNMFVSSPVIGIGSGLSGSRASFVKYSDIHLVGPSSVTAIHNHYLTILAENGIVGFALFYVFTFVLMYRLWKKLYPTIGASKRYPYEVAVFLSYLAILIQGFFMPAIERSGFYWIIIAMCIIALENESESDRYHLEILT